jgi:hypothetical protein
MLNENNLAAAKDEAFKDKGLGDHTMYLGAPHIILEQNGRRYLMAINKNMPKAV